ncbi:MAG: hypothetical protein IJI57_11845 [Flexilinea sp.]|nr:hypothetical protein [Flexilinea sp.]
MYRKRVIPLLFILLCFFGLGTVCAGQEAHVYYNETYYCGDSLEVIFPDEPVTMSLVTRNPGSKVIQAKPDDDTVLFEVRVKVRNLSNVVYKGLSPESFKLVGYIRGKALTYLPEIMEPYDYGPKEHYTLYDKMYYKTYEFAPLRKIDMILVYRINPIVRDLEMHINPKGTDGTDDHYLDAVWDEMDLEPCDGVFQFITIHDAETNERTKFYR